MLHRKRLAALAPLLMTLAAGCAPAYRCYSDCRVPCKYCASPPLPYTQYDGCVCHSCVSAKYLNAPSSTDHAIDDTDQGGDAGHDLD